MQLELARQKIPASKAAHALTDIGTPSIDWVALAQGMGVQQASRAHTSEDLAVAISQALMHKGPTLIECLL